eukprot:1708939-Prymnesium_polylepis.1
MAAALTKDPKKAERWRTAEIDAAISIGEIAAAIEQPPMADVDACVGGAAVLLGGGGTAAAIDAGDMCVD